MTADFKNNETESIIELIMLLSGRGYVLRSELERILRGCRNNRYTLSDIETLMRENVPEETVYINDSKHNEALFTGLEVQQILKETGFKDLYEYLDVSYEASDEEILLALKCKKNSACNERIRQLIKEEGRDTYELILRTQIIFEELQLRKSFNITTISQAEYDNYINAIILLAFVDKEQARELFDGFIRYTDISVIKDIEIKRETQRHIDRYLICADEDQTEKKDNTTEIKGDRGKNNG